MIKSIGYLIAIIKGSLITIRHFMVNMHFHFMKLFHIKTKRKGSVTIQYPEERREIAGRHRSLHRLMKREDGKPRCVVCQLCVTVCPSECIYVEAEEDPETLLGAPYNVKLRRLDEVGAARKLRPKWEPAG